MLASNFPLTHIISRFDRFYIEYSCVERGADRRQSFRQGPWERKE